jgi:hypothetical protein
MLHYFVLLPHQNASSKWVLPVLEITRYSYRFIVRGFHCPGDTVICVVVVLFSELASPWMRRIYALRSHHIHRERWVHQLICSTAV